MSSLRPEELISYIKASNLDSGQINDLLEFLEGICDAFYSITIHGAGNWSKGIDPYSRGMNSVSSFFSGYPIKEPAKTLGDSKPIDNSRSIDILNTIRTVAKNLIDQNGMKTIDELATVCIGSLGGNSHEQSNA